MTRRATVAIAGSGIIGSATGLMLREIGDLDVHVLLGDRDAGVARDAAEGILRDSSAPGRVEWFHLAPDSNGDDLVDTLKDADLLLDCLPGREAPRMAQIAKRFGLHYANITEHVEETRLISDLARGLEQGFLLQTGLAPGFVNVLTYRLFRRFRNRFGDHSIEKITMRVGALPQVAYPPHFYGLTWSPIGVATEYLEPAIIVRNHVKQCAPALAGRALLLLNGVAYEEALTSGGAADMPDVLGQQVKHINYKSLRYPGHFAWVQGLIDSIPEGPDRATILAERLREAMPVLENDRVLILATVEGHDEARNRRTLDRFYEVGPSRVGKRLLSAIQSTTAAGLAESARLLLSGRFSGLVLQSGIDPDDFLNGPFVRKIYGTRS